MSGHAPQHTWVQLYTRQSGELDRAYEQVAELTEQQRLTNIDAFNSAAEIAVLEEKLTTAKNRINAIRELCDQAIDSGQDEYYLADTLAAQVLEILDVTQIKEPNQ